jgi:hypothetical protein
LLLEVPVQQMQSLHGVDGQHGPLQRRMPKSVLQVAWHLASGAVEPLGT